jgi:hypothetical protein
VRGRPYLGRLEHVEASTYIAPRIYLAPPTWDEEQRDWGEASRDRFRCEAIAPAYPKLPIGVDGKQQRLPLADLTTAFA